MLYSVMVFFFMIMFTVNINSTVIKFLLNFLSKNLNFTWSLWGYVFSMLMLYFAPLLLMGSVPFIYILGGSGFSMFIFSFVVWGVSFFGSNFQIRRFFSISFFMVLLTFLFDSFVTFLRPVTLMLRIYINVSLGHFLIMMVHLNNYLLIIVVWSLEAFVYLVQMYVFMTLTKSYVGAL